MSLTPPKEEEEKRPYVHIYGIEADCLPRTGTLDQQPAAFVIIKLGRKQITSSVSVRASDPVWTDECYFISDEIDEQEKQDNLIAEYSGRDPSRQASEGGKGSGAGGAAAGGASSGGFLRRASSGGVLSGKKALQGAEAAYQRRIETDPSAKYDVTLEPVLTIEVYHDRLIGHDPLIGSVDLPMRKIKQKASKWRQGYWLNLRPSKRYVEKRMPAGQIRVNIDLLNFPPEMIEGTVQRMLTGSEAKQGPNQMRITILQARGLVTGAGGQSDDKKLSTQVRLSQPAGSGGSVELKSSHIDNQNLPSWGIRGEVFLFPAPEGDTTVIVTLENFRSLLPNIPIGGIMLPAEKCNDANGNGRRDWFPLRPVEEMKDVGADPDGVGGAGSAELELMVAWEAVPEPVKAPRKLSPAEIAGEGGAAEAGSNGPSSGEVPAGEERKSKEERDEAAKQREEEEKKQQKALEAMEFKDGDYQIQVHAIEARSLKPENWNGSCDPVVEASCMGTKTYSRKHSNKTNVVFDQVLFLNFKNREKDQLEEAVVTVAVYDAGLFGNTMVGQYSFDASFVYLREHHELHNQWVALSDPTNKADKGVQGYLKLSVAVLGPGDKKHVYDPKEEAAQAEKEKGAGLDSLLMMPPSIERSIEFLVLRFHEARDLVALDREIRFIQSAGIDAYAKVEFAGNPEITTPFIKSEGKSGELEVRWNTNNELWLPVVKPSMSDKIRITVMDHDFWLTSPDEPAGTIFFRYSDISQVGGFAPTWFSLYGGPDPEKVGAQKGSIADEMALRPEKASHYRGKVLMSAFVVDDQEYVEKEEEVPHKKSFPWTPACTYPEMKEYGLAAQVMLVSEAPNVRAVFGKTSFGVEVCCGRYSLVSEACSSNKGLVEVHEVLSSDDVYDDGLRLPRDPRMVPDVFVYLWMGRNKQDRVRLCYTRLRAMDLLRRGFQQIPAAWVHLKPDLATGWVSKDMEPGSILMRLSMGPNDAIVEAVTAEWKTELDSAKVKKNYCIRVHSYLARELPAADSDGSCDPSLRMLVAGKEKRFTTVHKSTSPQFYETREIHCELPPLRYAPPVLVKLYDSDSFNRYVFLSQCRIPLSDRAVEINAVDMAGGGPQPNPFPVKAKPRWFEFSTPGERGAQGRVLLAVQVLLKGSKDAKVNPPPPLRPPTEQWFVEVVCLGLRSLAPYQFVPVQDPCIEFDLGERDKMAKQRSTNHSKRPTGTDPNFCERVIIPVDLPADPLFAPSLNLAVRDRRLGGWSNPVVATTTVSLEYKIPGTSKYRPPQGKIMSSAPEEEEEDVSNESGESNATAGGVAVASQTAAIPVSGGPPPSVPGQTDEEGNPEEQAGSADASGAGVSSLKDGQSVVAVGPDGKPIDGPASGAGADTVDVLGGGAAAAAPADASGTARLEDEPAGKAADSDDSDGESKKPEVTNAFGEIASIGGSIGGAIGGLGSVITGSSQEEPSVEDRYKKQKQFELDDVMDGVVGGVGSIGSSVLGVFGSIGGGILDTAAGGLNSLRGKRAKRKDDSDSDDAGDDLLDEPEEESEEEDDEDLAEAADVGAADHSAMDQVLGLRDKTGKVDFDAWRKAMGGGGAGGADGDEEEKEGEGDDGESAAPEIDEETIEEAAEEEHLGTGLTGLEPEDLQEGSTPDEDPEWSIRNLKYRDGLELMEQEAMHDDAGKYLEDRRVYESGLEDVFQSAPFETYPLYRGSDRRSGFLGLFQAKKRQVGVFKGMIRLVRRPDDPDDPCPIDLSQLRKPKSLNVRVYVMDGRNLMPKDTNGASDPYMYLKLGGQKISDRSNFLPETLHPQFFRCYEMTTTLPGASRLELQVYDHDWITSDELIGETVMDLEDRWFEPRWRFLGKQFETQDRYRPKPVEERTLWVKNSSSQQGMVRVWVDIMTQGQAKRYPVVDIAPPPPEEFEVRMIVWRTRGVISGDYLSDMNDLYITSWVEGEQPQSTDVHWRCKGGKGSFNWRMKFRVKYPCKFPYLQMQMWDQDLFKYNDCLAQGGLNLGAHFKQAYREGGRYHVFQDLTEKARQARAKQLHSKNKKRQEEQEKAEKRANKTPIDESKSMAPDATGKPLGGGGKGGAAAGTAMNRRKELKKAFAKADKGNDGDKRRKRDQRKAAEHDDEDSGADDVEDRMFAGIDIGEGDDDEDEDGLVTSKYDGDDEDELGIADDDDDEEEKERQAAKGTVNELRTKLGLETKVHPKNAGWIPLFTEYKDGKAHRELAGEILTTIEILPSELTERYPAGYGRGDPNTNPKLPDPTGRLKWSWNPFFLLEELLGPALCGRITVILMIAAIIAVLVWGGPYLNILITWTLELSWPANFILLLIFISCCCCPPIYYYCRYVYCYDPATAEPDDNDYAKVPLPGEEVPEAKPLLSADEHRARKRAQANGKDIDDIEKQASRVEKSGTAGKGSGGGGAAAASASGSKKTS